MSRITAIGCMLLTTAIFLLLGGVEVKPPNGYPVLLSQINLNSGPDQLEFSPVDSTDGLTSPMPVSRPNLDGVENMPIDEPDLSKVIPMPNLINRSTMSIGKSDNMSKFLESLRLKVEDWSHRYDSLRK